MKNLIKAHIFIRMRFLLSIFLFSHCLFSEPARSEIAIDPSDQNKLIYYYELPQECSYPLMIALEGSYTHDTGPQSVLRLHEKLSESILQSGMGFITMERRGVDGKQVNPDIFHSFNTPSQRLKDHLLLVKHLHAHPLKGWDGRLVILGGSEGGPIAIKLSHAIHPSACIAIVGCGDQAFKELVWSAIQQQHSQEIIDLPADRPAFEAQIEKMKKNPDPTQWWFGHTFLYWADALDQTEHYEFLNLKCPVLVVAGSQDLECSSTDRLIETAKHNGQDVTYLRIEGMEHNPLEPQWKVLDQVRGFLEQKVVER